MTTTCDLCGTPVVRVSGDEGTHGFAPVYLLFGGEDAYPIGGAHDYRGMFASLEEAEAFAWNRMTQPWDWAHVVRLGPDGFTEVWHAGERYLEGRP